MTPDEMNAMRKQLAMLNAEHLQALPPEDLKAFIVTLRNVLEKAEDMRDHQEATSAPGWERLST